MLEDVVACELTHKRVPWNYCGFCCTYTNGGNDTTHIGGFSTNLGSDLAGLGWLLLVGEGTVNLPVVLHEGRGNLDGVLVVGGSEVELKVVVLPADLGGALLGLIVLILSPGLLGGHVVGNALHKQVTREIPAVDKISLLTTPALGAALKLRFHNLKAASLEPFFSAAKSYLPMYIMATQKA
jgi:hypothetical protein